MINKALLDRLIAQLQELSAKADGIEALEARHAEHLKAKAEHETVVRELGQFRRELSDLQLQYQDQRRQLGQLMADIVRRGSELQRIDSEITQAKQRAFGG